MPQPSLNDVHIDAILTNISTAYIQRSGFIANQVFPVVPVDKQSNKFFVYNKGDWFRDEAEIRGDGMESVASGYTLSTDTYSCDVYSIAKDIGYQLLANADAPLNPKRDATEFVTQRLLLKQEKDWVSTFFKTSVWGQTDQTGVSGAPTTNQFRQWSDYVNSDPLVDVEGWKETILASTGMMPNTLVLGYQVYRQLKNHPDVVDRFKYTSSSIVTTDMLSALFDVERVLVASAVENTAAEGATGSYSFTHGKAAMLCYVAPSPSLLQPSAGYTFAWTGISGGLGENVGIKDIPAPLRQADRIQAEAAWDNKIIGSDLGIFATTAVA